MINFPLKLIPFQATDYPTLINWIVDEETLLNFAGIAFTYPLTEDQLSTYSENHPERFLYLAIDDNSSPIAYGEIIQQDERSARLGHLIIGDSQQRGKGIGQKLIKLLNSKAKVELAFEQMDLYMIGGNLPAEKCYLKYGFAFVDNDFQIVCNGKSYDILKMTIKI